uniref:Mitochondrial Rho GTPase n=1 Tax=Guillardia theta TaxID=55529 RepID=A0A7S4H970_GUITH|mmetsp:Transcript_10881/g.36699  ORF Transcript_10881/g.36699 Transcript_10881/m.36699 type:complete len:658 (+) Transcript_10881:3-1976(+)
MVRVVVVGDAQVGKSSIIKCYISNTFDENLAPVIPIAVLPPDASPERVPLTLVDTSSRDWNMLEEEVRQADVAVGVYAADKPDTLGRVTSHWLPMLQATKESIPVVVAGNKLDLRSGDAHSIESELRNAAAPIMESFSIVETCIDCSAKRMINIPEVMLFATKAVLHPSAPLYDAVRHELKPLCIKALKRIFNQCDGDADGVLSDVELNKFQVSCFGSQLLQNQVYGIKNVLRRNLPDGVTERGITFVGFVYLLTLFIQRGRTETTWEVLRAYGYGLDLRLRRETLPNLGNEHRDQCHQLTDEALVFLETLFLKHDTDKDGSLSPDELQSLFDPTPGIPWDDAKQVTSTDKRGQIDLKGFIAQWVACCYLNPLGCMESLVYLGFRGGKESSVEGAIAVSQRRSVEHLQGTRTRTVFRITLLGVGGVDPFVFARSLLPRNVQEGGSDEQLGKESLSPLVISKVAATTDFHLIVESVSLMNEHDVSKVKDVERDGKGSDCIVIFYPSQVQSSFSLAWDAYAQLSRVNEGSPILFAEVNNKTSEEVDDIAIQSPSETCAQHHLPLPLQLSHDGLFASIPCHTHSRAGEGDQDLSPLWSSVVEACLQPHKSSPVLAERKRKVPALTRFLSLTFLPLALHVEATRSDLLLLRPRPRGSAGLL